jgi:DNA repair protein RadC
MDYSQYTNLELVQCVLGDDYEKELYRGMLAPLFLPEALSRANKEAQGPAAELIERWADRGAALPAPLSSHELIREYLRVYFGTRKAEGFAILLLNAEHELMSVEEMFRGAVLESVKAARMIMRRIVKEGGTNVVFVHHVPLGETEPGPADILLATRLTQVLEILEIEIVDYFVVVGNEPISFVERDLL